MNVSVQVYFLWVAYIFFCITSIYVEKGNKYSGDDLPEMPITLSHDDYMYCHNYCSSNNTCIAWTFKPKNCTTNAQWPNVPLCWLKYSWASLHNNSCHISGVVREPPFGCNVAVHTNQVTHTVNSKHMGCHSDSGYAHESRGLYAQMIYGNSFEEVPDKIPENPTSWINILDAGVNASLSLDKHEKFNGFASQHIIYYGNNLRFHTDKTRAGVANRGFGNEGLVLVKNKKYDGYFFVKSVNAVDITVALVDYLADIVLASKVISFGGGNWTKIDFELIPIHSTNCVGIKNEYAKDLNITCPINNTYDPVKEMSDRSAHICVQCSGQFTLTISQQASVWLDFVYLQPGPWGRFKNLPVRLDAVNVLQQMGISMIRQGGSFAKDPYYMWKHWRGPAYLRPYEQNWKHSVISGWGPFEMIDLCNAMDIVPIITTSMTGTATDMADLVEYCWGDNSTKWGAQRIADGHSNIYNVTYFELGNEQQNYNFVDQVKAMEAKAKSIGMGKTLYYIYPKNLGPTGAESVAAKALGLGSHLVIDVHIKPGKTKTGVGEAKEVFSRNTTDTWSAINMETNYGDHTMHRALIEAEDLNDFFSFSNSKLLGRAGSFCMERSGYNEAGLNDQGISFFLPNMTWLQPPGIVHAMVSESWQPLNLNITLIGKSCQDPPNRFISVQTNANKTIVVLRLVNALSSEQNVTITLLHTSKMYTHLHTMSLFTSDPAGLKTSNTPSDPKKVIPISNNTKWTPGQCIIIPPYSYNILTFT